MPQRGRYSLTDAVYEVAAMRDRLGLQDKDIYLSDEVDLEQSVFSKKMSGARDFTIEELGRIADFFSRFTGRPLPGFPFLKDETCRIIEARVYGARAEPSATE